MFQELIDYENERKDEEEKEVRRKQELKVLFMSFIHGLRFPPDCNSYEDIYAMVGLEDAVDALFRMEQRTRALKGDL